MSERITEGLFLDASGCKIGENDFGYVFPQGDAPNYDIIEKRLKEMGGKPELCELDDYKLEGGGEAIW